MQRFHINTSRSTAGLHVALAMFLVLVHLAAPLLHSFSHQLGTADPCDSATAHHDNSQPHYAVTSAGHDAPQDCHICSLPSSSGKVGPVVTATLSGPPHRNAPAHANEDHSSSIFDATHPLRGPPVLS